MRHLQSTAIWVGEVSQLAGPKNLIALPLTGSQPIRIISPPAQRAGILMNIQSNKNAGVSHATTAKTETVSHPPRQAPHP